MIVVALLLTALTGCSSGVERYGGFTFVSPGGQTELTYPVAERGTIGDLSGPDLTGSVDPSEHSGEVESISSWAMRETGQVGDVQEFSGEGLRSWVW